MLTLKSSLVSLRAAALLDSCFNTFLIPKRGDLLTFIIPAFHSRLLCFFLFCFFGLKLFEVLFEAYSHVYCSQK